MTLERNLALAGLLLGALGFFTSMAGFTLLLMEFRELSRKLLPWTVGIAMLSLACSTSSMLLRI